MAKTPKKRTTKKIILKKAIKDSKGKKYANKKKPTGDGGPRSK